MPGTPVIDKYSTAATAVAVVVTRGDRVLFGQRVHGGRGFLWQLPGGWIEPGETSEQAARREVREETGLELSVLRPVAVTDNGLIRGRPSIAQVFEAECIDAGEPRLLEPEKNLAWEWHSWNEIDGDIFAPLLALKQSGYRPSTAAL